VTVSDIAAAINSALADGGTTGDVVDKRRIMLGNPIKSLGEHQVGVKLHDELEATVTLHVVAA
jgi:large subunit ribosomal protein L9